MQFAPVPSGQKRPRHSGIPISHLAASLPEMPTDSRHDVVHELLSFLQRHERQLVVRGHGFRRRSVLIDDAHVFVLSEYGAALS